MDDLEYSDEILRWLRIRDQIKDAMVAAIIADEQQYASRLKQALIDWSRLMDYDEEFDKFRQAIEITNIRMKY